MEKVRKPFQGVGNIIRFNWHFYVLSIGGILLLLWLSNYLTREFQVYAYVICFLIIAPIFISLMVSSWVYDLSGLYELKWLKVSGIEGRTLNIHAGFDETSQLLKNKYRIEELVVFDFYDPSVHTEISIQRARKAYPPFPSTQQVNTTHFPLADKSVDCIFLIFSAHEIRDERERIGFFKELNRVMKPTGQIIITEHLRDVANFLAYNIGFFHFYSKASWNHAFVLHTSWFRMK